MIIFIFFSTVCNLVNSLAGIHILGTFLVCKDHTTLIVFICNHFQNLPYFYDLYMHFKCPATEMGHVCVQLT